MWLNALKADGRSKSFGRRIQCSPQAKNIIFQMSDLAAKMKMSVVVVVRSRSSTESPTTYLTIAQIGIL